MADLRKGSKLQVKFKEDHRGRFSEKIHDGYGGSIMIVPGRRSWDKSRYPIQDGDTWEVSVDGTSVNERGMMVFVRPVKRLTTMAEETENMKAHMKSTRQMYDELYDLGISLGCPEEWTNQLDTNIRLIKTITDEASLKRWLAKLV